jgi:serine/threonine protein kinase
VLRGTIIVSNYELDLANNCLCIRSFVCLYPLCFVADIDLFKLLWLIFALILIKLRLVISWAFIIIPQGNEMKLSINAILRYRYKILGLVGAGGYGSVYKAEDIVSHKLCAIKQQVDISESFTKQYKTEIEILGKIQHRNLPVVLDHFQELDSFFIVMEYVNGESLRQIVEKNGKLSLLKSVNIILQIADALEYLHKKKPFPILHRDVNPSNMLFRKDDGVVILVDFGLVKEDKRQETTVAAKAVTAGFSAIEQYGNGLTDLRSDIYSLGATFFYLLTGEVPEESVQRIEFDTFRQRIQGLKDVPSDIVNIILRATDISPVNRYQSISEFANDLKPFEDKLLDSIDGSAETRFNNQITAHDENITLSPKEETFDSYLLVKQIYGENGYLNIIDWKKLPYSEISYLIVKKYANKPRHQNDGKVSVVESPPFQDPDIENGFPVYYALYAVIGHQILKSNVVLGPIIRLDNVFDLSANRAKNAEVSLRFRLPKNAKEIIIKKSVSKRPTNVFDGTLVSAIKESAKEYIEVKDKAAENLPIYYTIFCRYKIKRSVLLTSDGVSILV